MNDWMRVFAVLVAAGALLLGACGDDDDGAGGAATSDTEATDAGDGGGDAYAGPGDGDSGGETDTDDDAGDDSDDALDSDLVIADFEYELQPVTTDTEVSFANLDSAPHTLTAEDDTFDTGTVAAGDSTTFTAPAAGEYAVFCTIHPNITGTLVVEE